MTRLFLLSSNDHVDPLDYDVNHWAPNWCLQFPFHSRSDICLHVVCFLKYNPAIYHSNIGVQLRRAATLSSIPQLCKNRRKAWTIIASVKICTRQIPVKCASCIHLGLQFRTFGGLWHFRKLSTLIVGKLDRSPFAATQVRENQCKPTFTHHFNKR